MRSKKPRTCFTKWENLCHRCGLCCYEKTITPDVVIIHTHAPCAYLDTETNQCTCYATRFQENPRCLKVNLWRAMCSPLLPPSCGYVQYMKKRHLRCTRKEVICEESH